MSVTDTSRALSGWGQFAESLTGADGERRCLERMLEEWRQESKARATAVYVEESGRLRLVASVGEERFPKHRTAERDAHRGEEDWRSLPLAGVELVAWGAPHAPELSPLALAIALAGRLVASRHALRRERFTASYRGVELEALYDVGLAIASTLELEELYEEVLLRAVSLLDARRGALYLLTPEGLSLERWVGGDARPMIPRSDPVVGPLLAGAGCGEGEILPGAKHLLCAPIATDGDARGLLVVGEKESRRGVGPFPESDRRTLRLFANQAAIAIKNAQLHRQALEKQRLERDLELAAEIQGRLLPTQAPQLGGFELAGWTRAARQVGGDYYDFLPLPDGRLLTVIADVTGKGMPAALMVSALHSGLRLLLDHMAPDPALAERLNTHLVEVSGPNKFITLTLAVLSAHDGEVALLNAGHNPALVVRVDGRVETITGGGLPLGLLPKSSYSQASVELAPGDLLVLYSDGICEATSPTDEEWGTQRLGQIVSQYRQQPLAEVIAAIDHEVSSFSAGLPQADDQTLLLIRRGAER